MSLSEKPIKDMSATEIYDYSKSLFQLGYSRQDIRYLTDNRISERQIRKFYKDKESKNKHNLKLKERQKKIKCILPFRVSVSIPICPFLRGGMWKFF